MLTTCGQGELLTIIETIGVPAFAVDVTEDRLFRLAVNRRYTDLHGVASSPVAAAQAESRYRRCLETAAPVEYEEEWGCADGRRWWRVILVPLIDPDGRIPRLLGTATDITDRKRAEMDLAQRSEQGNRLARSVRATLSDLFVTGPGRPHDPILCGHDVITRGTPVTNSAERTRPETALRAGEDWVRHLLGTIPLGVVEIDIAGYILFVNPAFESILGFRSGALGGLSLFELERDEAQRAALRGYLANLTADRPGPAPYVTTILARDGQTAELRFDWSCKRDEAGRATGFIAIVTEITERERVERELDRTRELYRAVLDGQRELICRFLPDGTLTYVNGTYHYSCTFQFGGR